MQIDIKKLARMGYTVEVERDGNFISIWPTHGTTIAGLDQVDACLQDELKFTQREATQIIEDMIDSIHRLNIAKAIV